MVEIAERLSALESLVATLAARVEALGRARAAATAGVPVTLPPVEPAAAAGAPADARPRGRKAAE